jgi:hypothetical protein
VARLDKSVLKLLNRAVTISWRRSCRHRLFHWVNVVTYRFPEPLIHRWVRPSVT